MARAEFTVVGALGQLKCGGTPSVIINLGLDMSLFFIRNSHNK
jgi:hypothetical protein